MPGQWFNNDLRKRLLLVSMLLLASACSPQSDTPASSYADRINALPCVDTEAVSEVEFAQLALLPVSSTVKISETKAAALLEFLKAGLYKSWCGDDYPRLNDRRMTGPYLASGIPGPYGLPVKGASTHNRVRVFYSRDVRRWLANGRRGALPDGAVMVKEIWPVPEGLHGEPVRLAAWAVMIRDSQSSSDGWLWYLHFITGNQINGGTFTGLQYGFSFCVTCHVAAESEGTFAFAGNLLNDDIATYIAADPPDEQLQPPPPGGHALLASQYDIVKAIYKPLIQPLPAPDSRWLAAYAPYVDDIRAVAAAMPTHLPMDLFFDHAVQPAEGHTLLTADQCAGCHDSTALIDAAAAEMMVRVPGTDAVASVAPFAQWQASMMGSAGRDPVFRAQLEYELHHAPTGEQAAVAELCTRCHQPAGHRFDPELTAHADNFYHAPDDAPKPAALPVGNDHLWRFGALARDGVNCQICHAMSPQGLGAPDTFSGRFKLVEPLDRVYGPFDDVTSPPMQSSLGIEPMGGAHLQRSELCASCHMLEVPVYQGDETVKHTFEQTTFTEWQMSAFNAPPGDPQRRTCQDCHMSRVNPFDADSPTRGRIANIEDSRYPYVPNRLPAEDLDTPERTGWARHNLTGINLFSMAMLQQFPLELGSFNLRPARPTNLLPPKTLAAREAFGMAREQSARLELSHNLATRDADAPLQAEVTITNLSGHRLPTGVNFRRAFVELAAFDSQGAKLWCSGCTNAAGLLIDNTRSVLESELTLDPAALQFDHDRIASSRQVQVFERREVDCDGRLTTSFLRLCRPVKDNRLLPRGWRGEPASAQTPPEIARITYELPAAVARNTARVRARLLYQALPPYYLRDRFELLGSGADPMAFPETQRLLHLASRLNTEHALLPLRNWVLPLQCQQAGKSAAATSCLQEGLPLTQITGADLQAGRP